MVVIESIKYVLVGTWWIAATVCLYLADPEAEALGDKPLDGSGG